MIWVGPELVAICWIVAWIYCWPLVPDVEPES